MTVERCVEIGKAIAFTVRELKSVPSGHVYAGLMGEIDLTIYTYLVDSLVKAGLVRKSGNVLHWTGE
ncbi:MAG: hypothetical protein L0220_32910 [Acidobacteria bacterium]|nr:hypothetical protein [Acidobacteriota bacterium]